MEIVNVIALIVVPILAVIIGQWLQNKAEKEKIKCTYLRRL